MKRILLTFIVITSLAVSASAQIAVGVKAGLNLANVGGDLEDTDMRPSFHLGGYLTLPLAGKLSLQPELLYNALGAKAEGIDLDTYSGITEKTEYKETLKFSYISIPVLVQYSIGPVNIHAGPQISFLASAKYDAEGKTYVNGVFEESFSSDNVDIKDGFKGMDFGFNLGAGVGFGKLSVTGRYSLGLANIADEDDDDDEKFKMTNNVIQLSIGYRLFGK
jgi:hypothetical protein